jgi:hypothetical protein
MDSSKGAGSEEVKLARSWTKARVCKCLNKKQKFELIHFLRDRYRERFFGPIRCLRKAVGNESGYGFAIMALCSLLIETLECYKEGLPSSHETQLAKLESSDDNKNAQAPYRLDKARSGGSKTTFKNFFRDHKRFFPDVAGNEFYEKVRCGLLHQAQTEHDWRIVRSGSHWNNAGEKKSINRDEFADRLQECFADYLSRLEMSEWDEHIWQMARRKIYWLTKLS